MYVPLHMLFSLPWIPFLCLTATIPPHLSRPKRIVTSCENIPSFPRQLVVPCSVFPGPDLNLALRTLYSGCWFLMCLLHKSKNSLNEQL